MTRPEQMRSYAAVESEIHVIEGASFMQYIPVSNDFRSCNVSFKNVAKNNFKRNVSIILDLHSENISIPSSYEDKGNLFSRLSSLGEGYCGFRLINSQKTDPEEWILSVETGTKIMYTSFLVKHYDLDKMHRTQKVTVGLSTTIECGRPITQSQDFCQIYNPNGELVFEGERCNLFIPMVTMLDLGTWRCMSGLLQSMDTLEYTIEVVSTGISENEGWVIESDLYYKIGCRILSNINPKLCRMVDPTGHEYSIRSNLVTERYTTFQTNLKNKTCGIEIPKPLLAHEYGIWKCDMENQGTLLYVGNSTDTQYNDTLFTNVDLDHQFSIKCRISYVADSCYIVSPNGSRYLPDIPTRAQLGECSLSVKWASKTDNGAWSCFFVRRNKVVAESVKFEVNVRDVLCTNLVKAKIGDNVELSCKTGNFNLQYCWFMSPTGIIYHLFNDYSSEKIAYSGKGLEYGDCTIAIFNIEEEQYGNWSCILRKGTNYRSAEEVHSLQLSTIAQNDVYQASAMVVFIGLIFGVVVTILFVVLKKDRRNGRTNMRHLVSVKYHRGSTAEVSQCDN
ncbi:hypothetical protein Trydic_g16330 [Trypoxylus dichotomus]